MLSNIQTHTFYTNDKYLIIATANFLITSHPTQSPLAQKKHLKQTQKKCVRALLKTIITHFNLANNELNESQFPYLLTDKQIHNPPLFVSFSHSQNKVALILSHQRCAIDLELNVVPEKVAKRYFSPLEYQYLNQLPNTQKQFATNQLWQLKECLIKYHNGKLFDGITYDCADIINKLLTHSHFYWKNYGVICQDDWTAIYQLS